MDYPVHINAEYVNPSGNLAASGYYTPGKCQYLANMMPPWMHLRDNPNSVGQQFLSAPAIQLQHLEKTINGAMRNQFIATADTAEPDLLYRVYLPSNIDITNVNASGVRCVAAPSGSYPYGENKIWVQEVTKLEDFYYNVLPTRLEVTASGTSSILDESITWPAKPSGVRDINEKHVDVWGTSHNLTWCYSNGKMRKQDAETMEDYGQYRMYTAGDVLGLEYKNGVLWALQRNGSTTRISMLSPLTKISSTYLDRLVSFDISSAVSLQPSGIHINEDNSISLCNDQQTVFFNVSPRYDYFILDKNNRFLYFREDYRNSGVFVSNT